MNEEDDRKQESQGSGWINLETMLGLNEQQGQQMGDRVTGDAQGKLNEAEGQLMQQQNQRPAAGGQQPKSFGSTPAEVRSQVASAKQAISGLQSHGGQAAALQSAYGKGGNYSAAKSGFDAFLAGTSIGAAMPQLKSNAADLEHRLGLEDADGRSQRAADFAGRFDREHGEIDRRARADLDAFAAQRAAEDAEWEARQRRRRQDSDILNGDRDNDLLYQLTGGWLGGD